MNEGFAFHCHHDRLVEWVFDFDGRVEDIKKNKPKEEQALRLRLFKLIPDDRIPPEIIKLRAVLGEARRAFGEARAGRAYDKTKAAFGEARAAYDKVLLVHNGYFLELHKELCPNCPWDGDRGTIF